MFSANQADLTGLNQDDQDKSLFVDEIVQKAFVEVNEEGTEAAAATGIMLKSLNFPSKTFALDKPFLYFIKDSVTGLTLFAGRVSNPKV